MRRTTSLGVEGAEPTKLRRSGLSSAFAVAKNNPPPESGDTEEIPPAEQDVPESNPFHVQAKGSPSLSPGRGGTPAGTPQASSSSVASMTSPRTLLMSPASTAAGGPGPETFQAVELEQPPGTPGRDESAARSDEIDVLKDFEKWRRDPDLAMAVAAIRALTGVIRRSEATTMMGLEIELKQASDALKAQHKTSISLSAGCNLFMRYVTRSALDHKDLAAGKARLIERGETFSGISQKAFVHNGSTILAHGFSRVVLSLLKAAAAKGKHFSVVLTGGAPPTDLGTRRTSWTFARIYPLDQSDLEPAPQAVYFSHPLPASVKVESEEWDYTPPNCLTLLFTDLGVLTPSAVSDELIQLYL
eukprot:jgi/Mesen1/3094/ME000184S02163